MTADLWKMAEEHVRDVTSGRLPPEDVASNIAEDFARVRSETLEEAAAHLRDPATYQEACREGPLVSRSALRWLADRIRALDPKGAAGR
jgi:hypothetical protein